MDAEDAYRELAVALRRVEDRADTAEREVAALRAELALLVDVLAGQKHLGDGHRSLLARVGAEAAHAVRPRVRLRLYVDKYTMPSADVDCASLLPLCHARCCSLSHDLTTQDLDEQRILWEVTRPYTIRHERDGHCSHLDRRSGACGVYEHRPATCRSYDCRGDPQIWTDFDRRIPAPMPRGVVPLVAIGAPR